MMDRDKQNQPFHPGSVPSGYEMNRALLDALVQHMPHFVYWKDRWGRYLGCNLNFAKVSGHQSPEELIGKDDNDLTWTREQTEHYRKIDEEVMSTGKPLQNIVETYRSRDGKEGWARTNKSPLFSADGEVIGVFGISEDITEQTRIEKELKARRDEMRITLESAPVGILSVLSSGKIVGSNPACCRMLGWELSDMLSMNYLDLFHPEDRARASGDMGRFSLPEGAGDGFERRLLRRDGSLLDGVIRGHRAKNADGLDFFVITIDDVSIRRRIAALERSKKAAEEANQLKSEFLANVSHELRTPMSVITGISECLVSMEHPSEVADMVTRLSRSSKRLMTLLENLLDISRVDAGKIRSTPRWFSLLKMVNEFETKYMPRANDRGLAFEVEITDELPDLIVADPDHIRQVLTNLLNNAFQYTKQGIVKLSLFLDEDTPNRLHFVIDDTGVGIDAKDETRVFEPFERTEDPSANILAGSGLGLSICRKLAGLLGGRVWVEPREQGGSRFHFTARYRTETENPAPVVRPEDFGSDFVDEEPEDENHFAPSSDAESESSTMKQVVEEEGAGEGEPDLEPVIWESGKTGGEQGKKVKKAKILLAEDNKDNQFYLELLVRKAGYLLDIANNGKEALEMLEQGAYDLVIMDIQMPELDGLEATRKIREQEKTKGSHIPVVALTAHAFQEDEKQCLKAGMDAFLSKPVTLGELKGVLDRWIKNT